MIYQRNIPREELFSSQLELLMMNARFASVGTNLVGVVVCLLLCWSYLDMSVLLIWAALVLVLLLVCSLAMSNSLVERSFVTAPKKLYRQLIAGAILTGAVWSSAYIYLANIIPETLQHVLLLTIVMITAFSVGVTVVIREYFVAYLFASLWPIGWWSLIHYWDAPYNLVIGLFLLLICAVLIVVSDRIYRSYCNMISLNLQREAMSRELGGLTGSLRDRNRQLRDARQQLTNLANVDELTGLGNRRLVNKTLLDEVNRARRSGTTLSVILLDVDYFKLYNDTYGHLAGDIVLQQLADLMQRATTRAGEVVARFGGEEFILVLPGASSEVALRTAQRLKALVNTEAIPHKTSLGEPFITVSQGIVTVEPDGDLLPEQVIKLADDALYDAKDSGRNAIIVSGEGLHLQEELSLKL
ncbi:MAG: GGDEF domain-containing protein [Halioglobus sp.]